MGSTAADPFSRVADAHPDCWRLLQQAGATADDREAFFLCIEYVDGTSFGLFLPPDPTLRVLLHRLAACIHPLLLGNCTVTTTHTGVTVDHTIDTTCEPDALNAPLASIGVRNRDYLRVAPRRRSGVPLEDLITGMLPDGRRSAVTNMPIFRPVADVAVTYLHMEDPLAPPTDSQPASSEPTTVPITKVLVPAVDLPGTTLNALFRLNAPDRASFTFVVIDGTRLDGDMVCNMTLSDLLITDATLSVCFTTGAW
jgi:hypothetical protein